MFCKPAMLPAFASSLLLLLVFPFCWPCFAQDATCSANGGGDCGRAADSILQVPPVIIGCWQLLEKDSNRNKAVTTLQKYADAGFTTFDTADIYGPSERILGTFRSQWIQTNPGRPEPHFFTKYVTDSTTEQEADRINGQSRSALGVSSLELVQFHFWSLDQHGRSKDFVKAGQQLMRLKSAGKVNHVAACNFDTTNLKHLVDAGVAIEANQVQYSLLDRRPEAKLLSYCKEKNIKLLVFGVVGGGLLSDAFLGLTLAAAKNKLDSVSRRMYFSSLQAWTQGDWGLFQSLLQTLRAVADRHAGATVAHVASQWVLRRLFDLGAGGGLIIGVRDAGHLDEHTRLLRGEDPLTDDDMKDIQLVLDKGAQPAGDIWDRERGWA